MNPCANPGCSDTGTFREFGQNGSFKVCERHLDTEARHHRLTRHGVNVSPSQSKADTQAVLIRGLGLGPTEAHEMAEKFGPQALEAAASQQDL